MSDYRNDFGPFDGKIWLNSASEGALPKVAVAALQEAISWKINPAYLTHQRFVQVPAQLKEQISKLMNVHAEDIILGNSATYGIHLLSNGIPFIAGDEILLMQNDFPTDILPWLPLKEKGVTVRQLPSVAPVITPAEIEKAVTIKTKLICLPHVHTFSGQVVDIEAIGRFCRDKKIIFVVNFAQSLGSMPLDFARLPVDAMTTAGFKWLCGPYGTGFCWMKKELRESLQYPQAFWVNRMTENELTQTGELSLVRQTDSKAFDVFGTANFFNFVPLTAAIQYLLKIGLNNVWSHIDGRGKIFLRGLDKAHYVLISREEDGQRSALTVFSHREQEKNHVIFRRLLEKGICLAKWKGNLRLAPHLFNTDDDIKRVLEVLNEMR